MKTGDVRRAKSLPGVVVGSKESLLGGGVDDLSKVDK